MIIALLLLFFSLPNLIETRFWRQFPVFFRNPAIQTFTIILLAVVLEALPFILIGSLISGLIEVYFPQERVLRFLEKSNKKPLLVPCASLLGLMLPVCECGIVAVVRRLTKKGVPLSFAVTYMLTGPIINLTVIASTTMAFWNEPRVILWRIILAFIVGNIIGLILLRLEKNFQIIAPPQDHSAEYLHQAENGWKRVLHHAEEDFFLMGKYLIIGAIAASVIQILLPRENLLALNRNMPLSIITLMILAFLLNLCSEADAFVANTFVQFPVVAKVAFLVFGPMTDLKIVIMWLAVFNKRLILFLVVAIFILTFFGTWGLGCLLK